MTRQAAVGLPFTGRLTAVEPEYRARQSLTAAAPGVASTRVSPDADGIVRTISEHQVRRGGYAAGQHLTRHAVNPGIGY